MIHSQPACKHQECFSVYLYTVEGQWLLCCVKGYIVSHTEEVCFAQNSATTIVTATATDTAAAVTAGGAGASADYVAFHFPWKSELGVTLHLS